MVEYYLTQSLAPSTQKTYKSGKTKYINFCTQSDYDPLPVVEDTLCKFAASIADQGLKHTTIKSYLSAIRHNMQIMSGFGDPFVQSLPKLEYVLRGIKLDQAKKGQGNVRVRLPMTPSILRKMRVVLERERSNFDNIMLWAACCTCFFGFLRSGEIVVPTATSYDPAAHLSFGDVTVDRMDAPTIAQITIKASKTDPFRKGISIYVGKTDNDLCPVAALTAYLAARGQPGPFFRMKDGRPLTRDLFVSQVKTILTQAGIDATKYSGHSFRIGAASTAAARGIEDSMIRTLGRWESAAYLLYVRVPRERLAILSQTLSLN